MPVPLTPSEESVNHSPALCGGVPLGSSTPSGAPVSSDSASSEVNKSTKTVAWTQVSSGGSVDDPLSDSKGSVTGRLESSCLSKNEPKSTGSTSDSSSLTSKEGKGGARSRASVPKGISSQDSVRKKHSKGAGGRPLDRGASRIKK